MRISHCGNVNIRDIFCSFHKWNYNRRGGMLVMTFFFILRRKTERPGPIGRLLSCKLHFNIRNEKSHYHRSSKPAIHSTQVYVVEFSRNKRNLRSRFGRPTPKHCFEVPIYYLLTLNLNFSLSSKILILNFPT